ncbi:MAG: aminoglycoside phosphotransferase family protein [Caldilineaceae bacterium]
MADLTQEIHTYLTTAPSSNFRDREVAMLAHWAGTDNLLWRVGSGGQEAVVKYYLDAGQARGRRQHDGQERYHAYGIAPKPLWFDRYPTGLSRQLLVYQWLPGEALATADDGQLAALAQAVARVHGGDPADVRRFSPNPLNLDYLWRVLHGGIPALIPWLQRKNAVTIVALLQQLVANGQTLVEAALPLWQGVAPTPVHGDLKLENIVSSWGTVVLLDWELFGLGDAAYDVATFLQMNQTELDEAQRERWLENYLVTFEQSGLAQRIGVYGRLLPLQNLCYLLHGLRQSRAAEAATIQDHRLFLQATLLAAAKQAASALNVETQVTESEFAALFPVTSSHSAGAEL